MSCWATSYFMQPLFFITILPHCAANIDIQGGVERYRLPLLKYLHKLVTSNGTDKEVLSAGSEGPSLTFLDNDSVL